jgi:hypothetical protein
MAKYQIHDDSTVIRHETDGSKTYLSIDDAKYQEWLAAGNQPLSADVEVLPPQKQEVEQLKKELAIEREDKLMLMEALADVYEMVLMLQNGGGAA